MLNIIYTGAIAELLTHIFNQPYHPIQSKKIIGESDVTITGLGFRRPEFRVKCSLSQWDLTLIQIN